MRAGTRLDQAKTGRQSPSSPACAPASARRCWPSGLARPGHERSHRRSQRPERRHRFRQSPPTPALPMANCRASLRSIAQSLKLPLARASLFRHAAIRHAGEFQRSPPQRRRSTRYRTPSRPKDVRTSPWRTCRAAPRLRRQEDPRAGDRRRLRHAEGRAQRLAVAQRPRDREQDGARSRRTAAPPSSSSRSKCPTAATKAKSRSIRPTRLPADDIFYFSVERADPRHALFVHDARDSTRPALFQGRARSLRPGRLRDRPGHRRPGRPI